VVVWKTVVIYVYLVLADLFLSFIAELRLAHEPVLVWPNNTALLPVHARRKESSDDSVQKELPVDFIVRGSPLQEPVKMWQDLLVDAATEYAAKSDKPNALRGDASMNPRRRLAMWVRWLFSSASPRTRKVDVDAWRVPIADIAGEGSMALRAIAARRWFSATLPCSSGGMPWRHGGDTEAEAEDPPRHSGADLEAPTLLHLIARAAAAQDDFRVYSSPILHAVLDFKWQQCVRTHTL
jgi:hypothetical protein